MPTFKGASKNRTSSPQTTRSDAKRTVGNGDVAFRHDRGAVTNGNRGWRGGTSGPAGERR